MAIYTGIGSRKIPDLVEKRMVWLGEALAGKGWILRSGAADGADSAFERGCDNYHGKKEIYLPWKEFNNSKSHYFEPPKRAYELAKKYHPNWQALNKQSKAFMARNIQQVLGELLYEPTDVIICWTPDGSEGETTIETGGTGQAIRIAYDMGIPIFNLKNEETLEKVVAFIKNFSYNISDE